MRYLWWFTATMLLIGALMVGASYVGIHRPAACRYDAGVCE